MAFVINRILGLVSVDVMLQRPRVSHKISEYVFGFINEHILKPANVLQSDKYIYEWTLSFSFKIPENHKILYKSPYSTDKRLYVPHKGFRTFEKVTKNVHLSVIADDINQNITPVEYAIAVYEMFADYLLYNYKKLKKETFDKAKDKLDISTINSFPFPAPFEDQKYMLDDNKYLLGWHQDYATKEDEIWIVPAMEYKKHYGS
jgi:hypothetical protein